MSAFEYLLKEYGLDDLGLVKLGAIIHDIEINYWGKKALEESVEINERVIGVIRGSESAEQALEACFSVFDGFMGSIGGEGWRGWKDGFTDRSLLHTDQDIGIEGNRLVVTLYL